MQQLWQLKIDWAESIPIASYTVWKLFELQLIAIEPISVPHRILVDRSTRIEIHPIWRVLVSARR